MEHYTISHSSASQYWNSMFCQGIPAETLDGLTLLEQPPVSPGQFDYVKDNDSSRVFQECANSLSPLAFSRSLSNSALLSALDKPVHLLVPSSGSRRALEGAKCHVASDNLPAHSLVYTEQQRVFGGGLQVLATSPEFTFLQLASVLSLAELLELGFSFCGYYYKTPKDSRGFADRLPVTTPERLAAYLDTCGSARGSKKARVAVRYILARAASPMETVVVLLFTLPRKLGGYGLPTPYLNYRIDIADKYLGTLDRNYFLCDICWPHIKLVVEFNGRAFHTGRERMALDTDKINILQAMGYTVVPLMYEQVKDERKFEVVVRFLRGKLGSYRRPLTEDQRTLQRDLRKILLP